MNLLYRIRRKVSLLSFRLSGNKRPSSAPYISGDTFRAVADHIHDETSTLDPQEVREGQTVFVKSDMLDNFFAQIHPHIAFPYVLISHNSDHDITESDVLKIDNKIIHWFAQNVLVKHPKVTPIPIGIENAHYHMHGVTKVFDSLRKKTTDKNSRILFGLNIKTNPAEREPAFNTLIHLPTAHAIKGWMRPPKYLKLLQTYGFVASPPGSGVDCHRTWEALYLSTIPIVKRSACMEYFQNLGLPIWIIDDWNELSGYTEDTLSEKYRHMQQQADAEAITIGYWMDKIKKNHGMKSFIKRTIPQELHEPFLVAQDWLYRLLAGFRLPVIITDIYGVHSILYPYTTMHTRWLLKRGMYTKEMRAMEKLISPSDTVFDIGANVGIISALIAKRFAPKGTIYSFEPLPETFQKLIQTMALNNLNQARLHQIAITNTNGRHDFYYETEASSELNSLGRVSINTELTQTMSKSVTVETATLDSFCEKNNISKIEFVKIDVEGFEYEVLEGMERLLKGGSVLNIQFEVSTTPLQSLGKSSKPIFELLNKHEYKCFLFDENIGKFKGPISDAHSNYDNYYASRNDLTRL